MLVDGESDKLARKVGHLLANDPQFAALLPDRDVSEAIVDPDVGWVELMRTVATGYADRPALGQRATEPVAAAESIPAIEPASTVASQGPAFVPAVQNGPVQTATLVVPRFDTGGWVYSERVAYFGDPSSLLIGSDTFEWVPLNSAFGVEPATSEVMAGQAWVMVPDTTGGGMYRAVVPTWASFEGFAPERFSSVTDLVDDQR